MEEMEKLEMFKIILKTHQVVKLCRQFADRVETGPCFVRDCYSFPSRPPAPPRPAAPGGWHMQIRPGVGGGYYRGSVNSTRAERCPGSPRLAAVPVKKSTHHEKSGNDG